MPPKVRQATIEAMPLESVHEVSPGTGRFRAASAETVPRAVWRDFAAILGDRKRLACILEFPLSLPVPPPSRTALPRSAPAVAQNNRRFKKP